MNRKNKTHHDIPISIDKWKIRSRFMNNAALSDVDCLNRENKQHSFSVNIDFLISELMYFCVPCPMISQSYSSIILDSKSEWNFPGLVQDRDRNKVSSTVVFLHHIADERLVSLESRACDMTWLRAPLHAADTKLKLPVLAEVVFVCRWFHGEAWF